MTASAPKFAVCMAVYNGMKHLAEQLDSILLQSDVEVTLWVSVDPSTDGTEEYLRSRARRLKNINTLPQLAGSGGAAQNFLRLMRDVDFTDHDYVALSDQDDIWLPHKLARAHQVITDQSADACSSDVIAMWPDGRRVPIVKSQPQVRWDYLFEAAGPGCTYVMTRPLALQFQQQMARLPVNDLRGVGLHDWLIYAYARSHGFSWVIDDQASLLYRQHEANEVGANVGWRAAWSRTRRILSGWGLSQSKLIAGLVGVPSDAPISSNAALRRWDLLKLAAMAPSCRRRKRDQIAFFVICVVMAAKGHHAAGRP